MYFDLAGHYLAPLPQARDEAHEREANTRHCGHRKQPNANGRVVRDLPADHAQEDDPSTPPAASAAISDSS
jgi:hypothetical protein